VASAQPIPQMIADAANELGVNPNLALEVAMTESSLNQNAVGGKGEIGVFQILPATANSLGINPANLQQNISAGVGLLATLLATYNGDEQKALAAYNAGPTAVNNAIAQGGDNWFSYIPSSTQAYVTNILGAVGTQYSTSLAIPTPTPADVSDVSDLVDSVTDDANGIFAAAPSIDWSSPVTLAVVAGVGILGFFLLKDVMADA
jgi:Transglycosylase SLT domain